MTTDPTAEAVKAAKKIAEEMSVRDDYNDHAMYVHSKDIEAVVMASLAAFTAAQLAGAGEQEIAARHSLVEENGRNHIGEAHLHVAHKDRGVLLSTISALRAENAALKAHGLTVLQCLVDHKFEPGEDPRISDFAELLHTKGPQDD